MAPMGSFCFPSGGTRGMGSVRVVRLSANLPCKIGLRSEEALTGQTPQGLLPQERQALTYSRAGMGRVRPAEDHHRLDSLPDILSQGRIADRAHGHGVKLTQGCQMHKLKICPLPGFEFLQDRGTANFGPEQDTEDSF